MSQPTKKKKPPVQPPARPRKRIKVSTRAEYEREGIVHERNAPTGRYEVK